MRSISRVSLETMVVSVLSRGFAMVGAIVVARTLGPAGKGLLTYATSVLSLIIALFAGHTAAIAYQYGRRGMPLPSVYATMMKAYAIVIVPLAAAIALAAVLLPGQSPLLFVAAVLPFAAYVQSTRGFFLADSEVRTANIQALVAPALFTVVGSVALIFFHASLNALLLIFVLTYLPAAAYSGYKLKSLSSPRTGEADPKPLKSQLRFTVQVGSVNFVNYLNNRVDLFIILFVLGIKAVGVYSVAIGIAEILWQLSGPVAIAAYGSIGTLNEADAAKLTAKCIRNTLPIALVVSIGTFLLAPPLVRLLFGEQFAEAGYVMRYFLPGVIAWSVMYHINTFITIQLGRPGTVLWIVAASATVCAASTLALVHKLGIASGAIGSSLGYLTGAPWAVMVFLRRSGISGKQLIAFNRDDWRRYVELFAWMRRGAQTVIAR